jgi:hypothetical protein
MFKVLSHFDNSNGANPEYGALISFVDPSFYVYTWTGAVNNDWTEPGNWNKPNAPGSGDDVLIKSAPNYPMITSGQEISISTLEVEAGAELLVDGMLTVESMFSSRVAEAVKVSSKGKLNLMK